MKFLTYFFTRILRYHINVLMFFQHISSFFYTWPNIIFSFFLYLSFFYENLIICTVITKIHCIDKETVLKYPLQGCHYVYKGIPLVMTSFLSFYGNKAIQIQMQKRASFLPSQNRYCFLIPTGDYLFLYCFSIVQMQLSGRRG